MRLNDEEKAMLEAKSVNDGAGDRPSDRHRRVLRCGRFRDVSQAHIISAANTDPWARRGSLPRRPRCRPRAGAATLVPRRHRPTGIDPRSYRRLGRVEGWRVERGRSRNSRLGVLMTDACINYERLWRGSGRARRLGDTGGVIYADSVLVREPLQGGLRSGGGPDRPHSAYGITSTKLAEPPQRSTSRRARATSRMGCAGRVIGEAWGPYWQVPVIGGWRRSLARMR